MTDPEIVAALEAAWCCPLGAALKAKVPQYENGNFPDPSVAAWVLEIYSGDAINIAGDWDRKYTSEALKKATAAGLRPLIVRWGEGRKKP